MSFSSWTKLTLFYTRTRRVLIMKHERLLQWTSTRNVWRPALDGKSFILKSLTTHFTLSSTPPPFFQWMCKSHWSSAQEWIIYGEKVSLGAWSRSSSNLWLESLNLVSTSYDAKLEFLRCRAVDQELLNLSDMSSRKETISYCVLGFARI